MKVPVPMFNISDYLSRFLGKKGNNQSPEDREENKTSKEKELYEYAKIIYQSDHDRYEYNKAQAFKYVSVLVFIASIGGYIGNRFLKNYYPPTNILELIQFGSLILFFISISAGFVSLWLTISGDDFSVLPLNDDVINYFQNHDLDTVYSELSEKMKEAHSFNEETCENCYYWLNHSYRFIFISIINLLLAFISFVGQRMIDITIQGG